MTDFDSHDEQLKINNVQMQTLLKQIFPDLATSYEYIYDTLKFLEESHVNGAILPRVIRGIHNIVIGTGKGEVIVHVHKDVSNVSVNERDVDEPTKV